ncbi:DUF397 domain-containing protein [Spirillospora sp. NPDC052269]
MVVWRKSSHSDGEQGACVELARLGAGLVGVRDSRCPDGGCLCLRASDVRALMVRVRRGDR